MKDEVKYRSLESFFTNSEPTNIVDEIFDKLEKDQPLLDTYRMRREQDFSYLAGQVFGGEVY
jgi:hypothetical protein